VASFAQKILAFLSFHITQVLVNEIKCMKERRDFTRPDKVPNYLRQFLWQFPFSLFYWSKTIERQREKKKGREKKNIM